MYKLFSFVLVAPLVVSAATFNGMISDSACGRSHAKMLKEHKDLKTNKDCTIGCIRAGSKYVLVSNGKVYNLDKQNMPELEANAGQPVTVTGDLKGDTITVSKIASASKKKK
jgi:hypothetical protein